ncbi:MAG: hypothetical protein Ta2A_07810 [Treponemataceae bacterium]|nr:MAG: hypothetical protein Ta2A_07810 [Treponemataceae bacterium]
MKKKTRAKQLERIKKIEQFLREVENGKIDGKIDEKIEWKTFEKNDGKFVSEKPQDKRHCE